MNIILDTNIIISAVCFPFSKPRQILNLAKENGKILLSDATFDELKGTLLKIKFDKYINKELRLSFLSEFKKISQIVSITDNFTLCRDSKDDKFLDLAACGLADYLITGDSDLLVLNPFGQTQIINPESFLVIIR